MSCWGPGWPIAAIMVTLVAIGLVIRLMIEDHTTHNKQLRIDQLERENTRLRREQWERTRPRYVSGNGKTGA
ncbi:MAG: hypothetical protein OES26_09940 [Gammaproteobacteria bacterium]|nr:hypothetical protein [Gammaproteobacteria bacterium]